MGSDVEEPFRIRTQKCLDAVLENVGFICNNLPSCYEPQPQKTMFWGLQEIKYFIHYSHLNAIFLV